MTATSVTNQATTSEERGCGSVGRHERGSKAEYQISERHRLRNDDGLVVAGVIAAARVEPAEGEGEDGDEGQRRRGVEVVVPHFAGRQDAVGTHAPRRTELNQPDAPGY